MRAGFEPRREDSGRRRHTSSGKTHLKLKEGHIGERWEVTTRFRKKYRVSHSESQCTYKNKAQMPAFKCSGDTGMRGGEHNTEDHPEKAGWGGGHFWWKGMEVCHHAYT